MLAIILINSALGISNTIDAGGCRRTRSDGNRAWNAGNFGDQTGRNGNLIIISARRYDQAQLIFLVHIENQRTKSAQAVFRVMKNGGSRRLKSKIASISTQAGV